jgi:acyl-CoA hydrolase
MQKFANPDTGSWCYHSRNHVHFIASACEMVGLNGKSIRQRKLALSSITYPEFREVLLYQAGKLKYN